MAEYVSKAEVKNKMIYYGFYAPDMAVTEFVEDILNAEDVVTVRHGHWIMMGKPDRDGQVFMRCSECGGCLFGFADRELYCFECGAKMDEGCVNEQSK